MSEPPRPIRPSDSSEPSGTEPSGSSGTESSGSSGTESSSLPSVREVMGEVEDETRADPTPDRLLVVDGRRWQIRVMGSTRSGAPGDSGAPLLLLRFSLAEEAEDSGRAEDSGSPGESPREGWAVGSVIADVPETELVDVLERARPVEDD